MYIYTCIYSISLVCVFTGGRGSQGYPEKSRKLKSTIENQENLYSYCPNHCFYKV